MKKGSYGAPGRIRTSNRLIRSQVLYPVELRALYRELSHLRVFGHYIKTILMSSKNNALFAIYRCSHKNRSASLEKLDRFLQVGHSFKLIVIL